MTTPGETQKAGGVQPSNAQGRERIALPNGALILQSYRRRTLCAFILSVIAYGFAFLGSIALIVTSLVIVVQPNPSFFQKAFATGTVLIGGIFLLAFIIRNPFAALQNSLTQASRVEVLLVAFQTLQEILQAELEKIRGQAAGRPDPDAWKGVLKQLDEGVDRIAKALMTDDWLNL